MVAVHGCYGMRMCLHLLLEQLVDAAIWQLAAPPSEPFNLQVAFPGGEQALSLVPGIWIGLMAGLSVAAVLLTSRFLRETALPARRKRSGGNRLGA